MNEWWWWYWEDVLWAVFNVRVTHWVRWMWLDDEKGWWEGVLVGDVEKGWCVWLQLKCRILIGMSVCYPISRLLAPTLYPLPPTYPLPPISYLIPPTSHLLSYTPYLPSPILYPLPPITYLIPVVWCRWCVFARSSSPWWCIWHSCAGTGTVDTQWGSRGSPEAAIVTRVTRAS